MTEAQKKQLQWFRDKQTKVMPDYDYFHEAMAKLGGINADEAYRQWGLSIKEYPALKQSRILANPLKAKGGLHPDKMAEILAQNGFVKTDEHGKHDFRDFEDKLLRAAAGEKIHGNAYHHDNIDREAEERYAREHYRYDDADQDEEERYARDHHQHYKVNRDDEELNAREHHQKPSSNIKELLDFFDMVGFSKSMQKKLSALYRYGKHEAIEDLAKAIGFYGWEMDTRDMIKRGAFLIKSHVKGYTRRSKSGAVTQVSEYETARQAAEAASKKADEHQANQNWNNPDLKTGARLHTEAGLQHVKAMHEAYKAGDSEAMKEHYYRASQYLDSADHHLSFDRKNNKARAAHAAKIAGALSKMANAYKVEHNHRSLDYGSSIHQLAAEHHSRARDAYFNGDDAEKARTHRDAAAEHGKKVVEISGIAVDATEHAWNASDRARIGGHKPEHHLDAARAHRKAAELNYDSDGRAEHENAAAEHEKMAAIGGYPKAYETAKAASVKANKTGKAVDHLAAKEAHFNAAKVSTSTHEKQNHNSKAWKHDSQARLAKMSIVGGDLTREDQDNFFEGYNRMNRKLKGYSVGPRKKAGGEHYSAGERYAQEHHKNGRSDVPATAFEEYGDEYHTKQDKDIKKSHVKGYTRRSKSGGTSYVSEYERDAIAKGRKPSLGEFLHGREYDYDGIHGHWKLIPGKVYKRHPIYGEDWKEPEKLIHVPSEKGKQSKIYQEIREKLGSDFISEPNDDRILEAAIEHGYDKKYLAEKPKKARRSAVKKSYAEQLMDLAKSYRR